MKEANDWSEGCRDLSEGKVLLSRKRDSREGPSRTKDGVKGGVMGTGIVVKNRKSPKDRIPPELRDTRSYSLLENPVD